MGDSRGAFALFGLSASSAPLRRAERGEQNLESRSALYSDPHLHPLPNRERRQTSRSRFRCSAKGGFDRVENFFDALKDLGVPESKHAVALGIEEGRAEFVLARSVKVLGAIEFDDEASFGRAEVGEVGAYGELAAEFRIVELSGSEMAPEDSLGFGLLAAEAAGGLLGRDVHCGECSGSERGREERNLESRGARGAEPQLHSLPGEEGRQKERNPESRGALSEHPHPRLGRGLSRNEAGEANNRWRVTPHPNPDPHLHPLPDRERRQSLMGSGSGH